MKKTLIVTAAATVVAALGGCIFVGDLLNPTLASSLGLPSGTTNLGSIVIRLNNRASNIAIMGVITSSNSSNPLFGLSPDGDFLGPDESQSVVVDCPVTAIYPAGVADGRTNGSDIANPAATVIGDDDMNTDVMYMGTPLMSGADFDCGDVINITLIETPGDGDDENADSTFRITVEVIKGT